MIKKEIRVIIFKGCCVRLATISRLIILYDERQVRQKYIGIIYNKCFVYLIITTWKYGATQVGVNSLLCDLIKKAVKFGVYFSIVIG
jgi:hypothetical protein